MKPGSDLKQASDPTLNPDSAYGRLCDAAKDFQQSGFTGTVPTDNANDVSLVNLKRNIFHGPKIFVGVSRMRRGKAVGNSRIRMATLSQSCRKWPKLGGYPSSYNVSQHGIRLGTLMF